MMVNDCADMDKMRMTREEVCGIKSYVKTGTLYSVLSTWKVRSYMLRVAGNYSHHQRYARSGWQCRACSRQVREDQDHLLQCEGYSDLVQGKNMDEDEELVQFYREVMARREEHGWD